MTLLRRAWSRIDWPMVGLYAGTLVAFAIACVVSTNMVMYHE